MAITTTVLHASAGGNGTTTYTTASFTPAANSLVLVVVGQVTSSPDTPRQATISGGSLVWDRLGYAQHSTNNRRVAVFAATAAASPSAMTITATWSGNATSNLGVTVIEVLGHHTAWPIAQIVTGFGTVSNPTQTLAAARDANSVALLCVSPNGNTPETGLVELADANSTWIARSDTTYDSTPSGTVSQQYWAGVAIELADAASTPPNNLPVTSGLLFDLAAANISGITDGDPAPGPWVDAARRNNATKSSLATYRTNRTPVGGPALLFAANGNYTMVDNSLFDLSTGAELFAVVKGALAPTSQNAGPFQIGGNDWTFWTYSDGLVYDGAFTNTRYSMSGVSPNDWHIINISHDGTTRVLRVDNTAIHTIAVGYTRPHQATKSTIVIGGASNTSGTRWQGDIAEVLAFNRALTSTERGAVYDFLYARHIFNAGINIDVPSAAITVAAPAPTVSPRHIDVPPAAITVAAPAPTVVEPYHNINVPPAAITVAAHPPRLVTSTVTLISPIGGAPLPSPHPTFTVAVTTAVPGTVEIQYATDTAFTAPVTLTADALPGLVTARVAARATAALTDSTTYHWRARFNVGYATTDWTDPEDFVISTVDGDAMIGGTWTVSDDTMAYPHLWFVTPPRGRAGDTAVAVGTGFGPTTPLLTIAGVAATVTDYQSVDPTADAYTDERAVDAHADIADPAHQRITFTVPDVPHPGGPLFVERVS